MAASYPTTAKTFTTKAAADTIQAAHVNDLQDEVTAIETALITGGLAHAVKITAGAGGAALTLPATGRIYLDGGGDTYLWEASANNIGLIAAGYTTLAINDTVVAVGANADLRIVSGKRFYLDNGSNTYLCETSADVMQLVTGGVTALTATATGIYILGAAVSFGVNNSAATGYRQVMVPNA